MPSSRRALRRRKARGRDKSLPYDQRWVRGQPGSRTFCDIANLCRGRCSHRPGDPALPQVSAGGVNPSPTTNGGPAAKPDSRNQPDGRRAGCPHPAGTRAAANTYGRIWNPPLRNGKACGQPGSRTLCGIANLCRGRCLHRPGDLVLPQVSAGGINPSPTTNGGPAPTGQPQPPGRPQGGMPSSRRNPRCRKHPRADMESAPTKRQGPRPSGEPHPLRYRKPL